MVQTNIDPQQLLRDLQVANEQADDFLTQMSAEVAGLDAKYVQSLITDDMDKLQTAKSIIEGESA
jgi:hypothetical protein